MSKMKMVSYEDYRKVIENVRKIGLFNKFTELEQLRQDNGMPENSLDEYILQLAEPKSPEEYERILETIEEYIKKENETIKKNKIYKKVVKNLVGKNTTLFKKLEHLDKLCQDNGKPQNFLDKYMIQLAEPKSPEEYERILETIEADIHNE